MTSKQIKNDGFREQLLFYFCLLFPGKVVSCHEPTDHYAVYLGLTARSQQSAALGTPMTKGLKSILRDQTLEAGSSVPLYMKPRLCLHAASAVS
jgi:hypothetical protein